MIRRLLSIAILFVIVLWLVLSYMPPSAVVLPKFQFTDPWIDRLFSIMAVGGLIAFVLIQVWLVWSTVRVTRISSQPKELAQSGGLKLGIMRELFWSVLPLAMTVAVAIAGYWVWLNIASH